MNTSPYLGSSIPPWTCRIFLAGVCFSQFILSLASNCILFFERQPVLKLCISISSTYSFLLISICYHPLSSAIIRYHPLSSTFINFHLHSSMFIMLAPLALASKLSLPVFWMIWVLYPTVPGCTRLYPDVPGFVMVWLGPPWSVSIGWDGPLNASLLLRAPLCAILDGCSTVVL